MSELDPRFVLSIEFAGEDALRLEASSPAGHATKIVAISTEQLVPLRRPIGDVRDWDEAQELGAKLFSLAFPEEIDQLLEESRHRAGDEPLYATLKIDDEDLAAIPWELTFDPEIGRFLALSQGTNLYRTTSDALLPKVPEKGIFKFALLPHQLTKRSWRKRTVLPGIRVST